MLKFVFRREDENEEDFYFDESNKNEVVDAEADAELNSLFDSLMRLEDSDQMTTEDLQAFFDSDCNGDDIVSSISSVNLNHIFASLL